MTANANRLINLHCGLGRDSITMVLLAIEGRLRVEGVGTLSLRDVDAVVFSDTGCEWPHTYELIGRLGTLVEAHGSRLVVLAKGDRIDGFFRPSTAAELDAKAALGGYHNQLPIMADYQSRSTCVSLGRGDCTDKHKIAPLRRFMRDQARVRFGVANNAAWGRLVDKGEREPHLVLIGIAADEQRRLEGNHKQLHYVRERYPLVTMGIGKADEASILERHGFGHVRKSGCFMCPYQPMAWFWALSVTDPERFVAVCEYERQSLARNAKINITGAKRTAAEGGGMRRIADMVKRWRQNNPHATVDEVLDKQYSRVLSEARAMRRAENATLTSSKRRLPMVG